MTKNKEICTTITDELGNELVHKSFDIVRIVPHHEIAWREKMEYINNFKSKYNKVIKLDLIYPLDRLL